MIITHPIPKSPDISVIRPALHIHFHDIMVDLIVDEPKQIVHQNT